MKRLFSLGLAIVLLIHADAHAQLTKSREFMALFRGVIAKAHASTVRVIVNRKEVANGIIVSADGWILTKFSEVNGDKIVCRLPDDTELEAERFGHDEPFDLLMLKVNATGLKPVVWTDSKKSKVGHWVASVGTGKEPAAVGVVSVAARDIKGTKFVAPSGAPGGYLGIAVDDSEGIKVQEVFPKTPANKAGIKPEDVILAVNGDLVQNVDEFLGALSRHKVGEEIKLKIKRAGKEIEVPATLGERPGTINNQSRGEMQNKMGSKLSDRRAGFPVILQHDAVLRPNECGGPLVNLDGEVIGMNIARAGRTETYAIPSEAVRKLIERLKKAPNKS